MMTTARMQRCGRTAHCFDWTGVGISTPGVPGPTSKLSLRAPTQMGWRETEHRGGGGNRGFVLSCARVGALAVGVTSVREGERESRATTLSYEGPGPSFYRCKERVQVYNGGVAIC
jgi:hypothetical protein